MNLSFETRFTAEKLASRATWAVVAAAGLISYAQLPLTMALGTTLIFALSSFALSKAAKDESTYKLSGAKLCSTIRLLLAVACGGTLFVPSLRSTDLWVLSALLAGLETFVSANARWSVTFALPLIAVQFGAGFAAHTLTGMGLMPMALTAFAAAIGFVSAQYRERGEALSSKDHRLSSLLACGSELAASCDLDSTILHTLKSAVHETGATCGYVMLLDDQQKDLLVTEAAYGVDGEFQFPESMAVGSGMSGYVAKVAQAITVSQAATDSEHFDGITAGVRSAASVPLVIRSYTGGGQAAMDQVLGVMTLLDVEHSEAFNDENMELLRTLASLVSVAVSNARMEERRRTTFLLTLESLATALEARDEYTRGHSQRVCEVSLMIGEKLGLGVEAMEELRVGTILHDIGKIGVPDAILNKRARLTDDEFVVMKSHPVIGYEICKPLMLSEGVLMIIRNHHEKLDGSGYPDGLKGGELPLSLRIVCVADAFDAMSSRRPYRTVMDTSTVLAELSRGAGTQFDPVVVENLKELMITDRLLDLYKQYWGDIELKVA